MTAIVDENRGSDGAGRDDTDRPTASQYCPSIDRGSGHCNVTIGLGPVTFRPDSSKSP